MGLCFLVLVGIIFGGHIILRAGSYPSLDWSGAGRIDWDSGYAVAYGRGAAPAHLANHSLRRAAAQKAAYIAASRNLIVMCLDLRIRDEATLRDYFKQDAELQDAFREMVRKLPPWSVVFGSNDEVRLALSLPLGGPGSVTELLGELAEEGPASTPPTPEDVGMARYPGEENPTGLLLLVSSREVSPALKPQILASSGEVILDFRRTSAETRSRPAYIAYYDSLERALEDPVLGEDPVIVSGAPAPGSTANLVLPPHMESHLLETPAGRDLIREARIVVVLQQN